MFRFVQPCMLTKAALSLDEFRICAPARLELPSSLSPGNSKSRLLRVLLKATAAIVEEPLLDNCINAADRVIVIPPPNR
jgi:hypothetical protein